MPDFGGDTHSLTHRGGWTAVLRVRSPEPACSNPCRAEGEK